MYETSKQWALIRLKRMQQEVCTRRVAEEEDVRPSNAAGPAQQAGLHRRRGRVASESSLRLLCRGKTSSCGGQRPSEDAGGCAARLPTWLLNDDAKDCIMATHSLRRAQLRMLWKPESSRASLSKDDRRWHSTPLPPGSSTY